MQQYYDILQLPQNCSLDDIKKSFRRLSLKHHPDKSANSSSSSTYAQILEAYQALMNLKPSQELQISPTQTTIHTETPTKTFLPPPIVKELVIDITNCINGTKKPIHVERWYLENNEKRYENVTLYVDIFEGIDDDELIVLKGEGNVISYNCKSDVKIFIKVTNTSEFHRKGLDLIYIKKISLKEALCGFEFQIKMLNNKLFTIKNKKGNTITPSFEKEIPNLGLSRDNRKGSLIIRFDIIFPSFLSDAVINELESLL